ncbi:MULTISPECIES: cyclic diguanylate phosphodiesterase [Enterobacter]|uniref:EAL domain-containing protein n=1 Tax=Enterobacter TaxID=547 RepID=UPI000FEB91A3|nr:MULTISPECIES: cyclic diguanylate phosphodiesterase [Enterobacter]MCR1303002.1 cyclic diguanylate phosphodiesterase [Enterobacter sp. FL1277]MCR1307761.1 cyclic diguanylate phosphodiesterase [Enterobacter sp. BT1271]MCR1313765.1 cyclic diguanylate phosphodiesterase [Enterobacter sp. BT855]MCR1322181.1 cyclic diguanylate phosphodiesterase [Enterobacter sp. BT1268]MCR1326621.1 cyclic diguanylate phosphodiesterase [Enterobacter sp. BT1131]
MRNLMMPILCALFLFLSGMLIINWQLWHMATLGYTHTAAASTQKIDNILAEAVSAANTAKHVAAQGCTRDGQLELGTEAALKPHLRAVMIQQQGQIICTSLPGNGVLIVRPQTLPNETLMLLPGNRLVNGIPVLIFQMPIADGRVIVSVSDAHLRDVIASATNSADMALVVGERMLARTGDVTDWKAASWAGALTASAHFPFSVVWQPPAFFSLTRLLQQGWSLILLILVLSTTVGFLIRRYKGKSTSFEDDLRKAILHGEIVPYYQPIVNGDTGGLYGVEVLARWKHPKSGFISPDVFIPIAERNGLIIPLTKGLMAKVVTQLKPLLPKLPDGFHIGVNISARHINAPSFIGDCRVFGKGFQGKEVKLVLEVTEREPLIDNPHLVENLNTLHNAGFVIALDDFGTGYSGLSCLNALAIDYIKIDKSFVNRVSEEKDSTILLDCVIDLAKKMSLRIVAEGVETKEQLEYLNRNEITLLQGYYFGKPVSYIDFIKVILSKPRESVSL